MRTFLSISLSWLIRDGSGLRSQIAHKHGIRKIFRHSTIIGLSSSLTIVGRGCYTRSEYRAPLFIAHLPFPADERAGGRPVPRLERTKVSPGNSARAGWAQSRAPFLFLAVCKRAHYNAAPAAAVPTCCCLVRAAPIRLPRAASNIRSPTTDNCRCSSEICDLSVIYRLPRRTLYRQ